MNEIYIIRETLTKTLTQILLNERTNKHTNGLTNIQTDEKMKAIYPVGINAGGIMTSHLSGLNSIDQVDFHCSSLCRQGFFSHVSGAEIRPHSQCKLGDFFSQFEEKNSQSELKIILNSS